MEEANKEVDAVDVEVSTAGVTSESNVVLVESGETVVDLKEMSKVSVSLVTFLCNLPAGDSQSSAALGSWDVGGGDGGRLRPSDSSFCEASSTPLNA